MIAIQKKLVIDEQGQPQEVIISWQQYQVISEMLGLDLDKEAIEDLRQARQDRATRNRDAYVRLDALDG
jgi:PHD/YefM family antitoxin component YafN of YafNO toxin-antitoxin module